MRPPKWAIWCFVVAPLVMIAGCIGLIYDVPLAGWVAFGAFVVTAVAGFAVLFFDADPFG